MILGIDEVGRGPWAGPLVVGAVVLGGAAIDGLTDSKKLSKKRREALDVEIREKAHAVGLGWVHAEEIDLIGLSEALRLATIRAVEQISVPYHEIIIDGTINFLKDTSKGDYVTTMAKADLLVPSVSAASIVAKVARDNYMAEQDDTFPGYSFANHVGYGTAAHIRAINELGVTRLHRLSFAPLAKYRNQDVDARNNKAIPSHTSKSIGDAAEALVVDYLASNGHRIVVRNWRTKWCEIDIISIKDGVTYFTEVKYRRTRQQGGGVAAITARKRQQMAFAAQLYSTQHKPMNGNLRVVVAELIGNDTVPTLFEVE